jgi:hypothetical protein
MDRNGPGPSSQYAACSIVMPDLKVAAWNKVLDHINGLLVLLNTGFIAGMQGSLFVG